MSGEPVICSSLRLSRTLLMPQAPSPIETAPKTMRTTLAAIPPYLKRSLMATPFSVLFMRLSFGEPLFRAPSVAHRGANAGYPQPIPAKDRNP